MSDRARLELARLERADYRENPEPVRGRFSPSEQEHFCFSIEALGCAFAAVGVECRKPRQVCRGAFAALSCTRNCGTQLKQEDTMAIQTSIPVNFEAYFPGGAFMVGEVEPVVKWSGDGQRQGHDRDKNSGIPFGRFA